jgi:hypothetical protein
MTIDLGDVVKAHDIRMRDLAADAHFFVESLLIAAAAREEFDGDGLSQPEIVGAIDDAHSAATDQRDDAISAAENRPRCELQHLRFRRCARNDRRRLLGRQVRGLRVPHRIAFGHKRNHILWSAVPLGRAAPAGAPAPHGIARHTTIATAKEVSCRDRRMFPRSHQRRRPARSRW